MSPDETTSATIRRTTEKDDRMSAALKRAKHARIRRVLAAAGLETVVIDMRTTAARQGGGAAIWRTTIEADAERLVDVVDALRGEGVPARRSGARCATVTSPREV